ncbi:deoxynucleotidyltransferase terminal-interacting protein 2 [Trichogramma pretiosum]|uniref:deoxynucleotidyltransferase terminal-interacting protein 2 n=1 Tax=Trichogramma pretiosum TaxID=7493 RepID=UPI0006C9C245|nr:deoxynucleotidyltransferase terminal-interacting protein 2 [Trichogramma pretiosum]
MEFFIDTVGQTENNDKVQAVDPDDDFYPGDIDFNPSAVKKAISEIGKDNLTAVSEKKKKNEKKAIDIDQFEEAMGWKQKKRTKILGDIDEQMEVQIVKQALKNSNVKPGFEGLKKVPNYDVSEKKQKERRKRIAAKTKGVGWFNLPATELTEEVKHDLEVIQMRSALDPKHFYKRNDSKALPKYFHIGKVVDSAVDFYSGRLTNKERKRTIVDELMANAEFAKYNKRKYQEIIEEKRKTHYKAARHAKRQMRKKNK